MTELGGQDMRYKFEFVFDSGRNIVVIERTRGQAIQLLSDSLSIPNDFIKSHCKITNLGRFVL